MGDIVDKVYWVWLSSIPGIGAKRFYYLVKRFGSPKAVWELSRRDILDASGLIGDKALHNVMIHKSVEHLEKAQKIVEDTDIRVITLLDDEYPKLLKAIYDPPPVLYCKGQPLKEMPYTVSIVGSRRTSEYGRQMAERLAYELSCAGVTVVSGLARGIDAMAHRGAIRAGGYTIGVLGCGVDVIYPRENKKLFIQMLQQGTLMSEYPPGTQPAAGNFPARNRIISGLSQAVVVVEAGSTSGALITADFALEQGREVYALPGNVTSPYSSGTNRLIKEGATPVTDAGDILEALGINAHKGDKHPLLPSYQLDIFEMEVYNALEDGEKLLEELAAITGFDMGKLNAILTLLEMKGIVKQLPGGRFARQWMS